MIEIADIRDKESLEQWLDDKPRELAVVLAHRAAARVMPIYWGWCADGPAKSDLAEIAMLRVLTTSQVCAVFKIQATENAAKEAANFATFSIVMSGRTRDAGVFDEVRTVWDTIVSSGYAAADLSREILNAAFAVHNENTLYAGPSPWSEVQRDASHFLELDVRAGLALWYDGIPPRIAEAWQATQVALTARIEAGDTGWQFWIDWYEAQLSGADQNWEMMRDIVLIPDEDWAQGADHANRLIAEIVEKHRATGRPDLSQAFPVDFTFDALQRVMRMVGIEDDTAHLRDPVVVQSFLDDCEELRDALKDFADYAEAGKAGRNHLPMLHLSADKVLAELKRTKDTQHLRARHIVRLAGRLGAFSKEEGAREELGKTLSSALDDSLGLLRTVTRRHFGPSYTALAPLTQLSLDHVDQDAVVSLFDQMIERLEVLPSDELIALDEDGMSVFRDMIRELHEFRAAITEASSDEFRQILEQRFAESIGGTGLAFGRFFEKSSAAAGTAGRAVDTAVKGYKRANGLSDIIDAIRDFLASGGTS